ncbi:MAG: hypothetical protein Q7R82_01420 [Candidatus Daviesbacteria bacterium]|nr:hypothetical protein [Candidatus Daviesbacteria bacterium]
MRFFIALEIPNENLPVFQSIQASLHTLIPQARLTDVDKIHIIREGIKDGLHQHNTLAEIRLS